MKIDFNYKFKNLDGETIREQGSDITIEKLLSIKTWEEFETFRNGLKKGGKPFTLRTASVNVLLMPEMNGSGRAKEINGEKKLERYQFAKKIHESNGLVDLRSEQITLLKELIGKSYPVLTVGQAYEILDPHEAGENKEKK